MRSNETKILNFLIETDGIHDSKAKGIALFAIDNGYESLSLAQKGVINRFFNPRCEGDLVHKDCLESVSNIDYVKSIESYPFLERISCGKCLELAEMQQITWNRIRNE